MSRLGSFSAILCAAFRSSIKFGRTIAGWTLAFLCRLALLIISLSVLLTISSYAGWDFVLYLIFRAVSIALTLAEWASFITTSLLDWVVGLSLTF
jgi:hypothetical protein